MSARPERNFSYGSINPQLARKLICVGLTMRPEACILTRETDPLGPDTNEGRRSKRWLSSAEVSARRVTKRQGAVLVSSLVCWASVGGGKRLHQQT